MDNDELAPPVKKHTPWKTIAIIAGVIFLVFVVIVVLVGLGFGIYYLVKHDNNNSIPTTAAATNNGTVADGSNSALTYTDSSYTGSIINQPPTTGVGCSALFNQNYVGYNLVNNSNLTQNVYLYAYYQGSASCMNVSPVIYPIATLTAGASLWWKDNTINNTVKTFYYNTLIRLSSSQGIQYYAIGNGSNFLNPINNHKQYLNIVFGQSTNVITVVNN